MDLPVMPPVAPMLAKPAAAIPAGMHYEPKWDGFRSVIFRDGDEVEIGSRNERPMTRYFPELVAAFTEQLPQRCVLDGEIVIAAGKGLDFEALLQRVHPAASRVKLLSEQTPASFVAFDLLADGDTDLTEAPFRERRDRLEQLLAEARPPIFLTPATTDRDLAQDWFTIFEGAGLDGVIAKAFNGTYQPNKRMMTKIKHLRTADCVVGGFRWHKSGPVVGSLLLALYDSDGELRHIGVTSAFTAARRRELLDELAPYREDALADHPWADWAAAESAGERMPGANVSRWNRDKDLSWEPIRPELVVEVAYDHMEGSRLRHTAQFRSWRPDRTPRSCTFDQLDRPVAFDLAQVLAG